VISARRIKSLAHSQTRVSDDFFVIEGIDEVKEELPPPLVAFSSLEDPWSRCAMRQSCEEEPLPSLATETLHPSMKYLG
jgi:hypothetical protein